MIISIYLSMFCVSEKIQQNTCTLLAKKKKTKDQQSLFISISKFGKLIIKKYMRYKINAKTQYFASSFTCKILTFVFN